MEGAERWGCQQSPAIREASVPGNSSAEGAEAKDAEGAEKSERDSGIEAGARRRAPELVSEL